MQPSGPRRYLTVDTHIGPVDRLNLQGQWCVKAVSKPVQHDQTARQPDETFDQMKVAFMSKGESAVLAQPADRLFHHPAMPTASSLLALLAALPFLFTSVWENQVDVTVFQSVAKPVCSGGFVIDSDAGRCHHTAESQRKYVSRNAVMGRTFHWIRDGLIGTDVL